MTYEQLMSLREGIRSGGVAVNVERDELWQWQQQ